MSSTLIHDVLIHQYLTCNCKLDFQQPDIGAQGRDHMGDEALQKYLGLLMLRYGHIERKKKIVRAEM
jgi:hypothetical protein